MRFVRQLDEILQSAEGGLEKSNGNSGLEDWNVEIEAWLFADPKERAKLSKEDESEAATSADEAKKEIVAVVQKLQGSFVLALSNALAVAGDDSTSLEERTKLVFDHILNKENGENITEIINLLSWASLENIVRTSSNFLRWYLQGFLQKHPLVYPMSSAPFQSLPMLAMILFLIEHNAKVTTSMNDIDDDDQLPASQRFARYASLLLFYATFSPRAPNDEDMQKTHERLVNELNFLSRALKLLTYPPNTSAPLALSLIRNVHNLLATFAGAITVVQKTGFPYDSVAAKAPWSPKQDDNTNGLITYPSIFRDILIWSLTAPNLPAFPGPKEDKRPELVVEILGIIFAMGGGEVTRALRYPCPNAALSGLVITSLQQLDPSDARLYQVKLSTITILTDADPSFGTFLVEKQAVSSLLEIAERQIDTVLEQTQVDDSAISSLVPSLAVLYKFSAGNPTFREATKDKVFPPEQEDHFWQLAQQQLTTDASQPQRQVPAAKNMHPLDAPRDSLRWKLIRLMTWTESHIKRYASELLWALCDEDPKEFVLRTGLGNAMAFLGAKGMIQLPAHAFQGE